MEAQNKPLTQQEKAVSLFEFIRELNKLKQKVVLNMKEYLLCRPMSEMPDDPEHIHIFHRDRVEDDALDADQGNVLLSVQKPKFERCPAPDAALEKWLIGGWDSFRNEVQTHSFLSRKKKAGQMDLFSERSRFKDASGEEEELEWFSDDPKRVEAFEAWKEKREDWAKRQKLFDRTLELFNDLYKRYFELELNPETLEFIVSNGVLMDRSDPSVRHPVLTKRVKLRFDPDTNTICIEEVEGQSELYSVVFQTMNDINLSAVNQLQDDLRRNDYHPLDRNETPGFLKVLIHQLSSDSIFSDNGIPEDWKKQGRLLLYMDPCYILRRRLDGTPKAIERIIEHIQDTGFVSPPTAASCCSMVISPGSSGISTLPPLTISPMGAGTKPVS